MASFNIRKVSQWGVAARLNKTYSVEKQNMVGNIALDLKENISSMKEWPQCERQWRVPESQHNAWKSLSSVIDVWYCDNISYRWIKNINDFLQLVVSGFIHDAEGGRDSWHYGRSGRREQEGKWPVTSNNPLSMTYFIQIYATTPSFQTQLR